MRENKLNKVSREIGGYFEQVVIKGKKIFAEWVILRKSPHIDVLSIIQPNYTPCRYGCQDVIEKIFSPLAVGPLLRPGGCAGNNSPPAVPCDGRRGCGSPPCEAICAGVASMRLHLCRLIVHIGGGI